MALRNIVARMPEFVVPILECGAEACIRDARHLCEDEAKAALRDLGCQVELKELWKGTRGEIAYE